MMRWSFADKVELADRQTSRQGWTKLAVVWEKQQQQSNEKMNGDADADGATRVWSLDCCRSDGCVSYSCCSHQGSRCLL